MSETLTVYIGTEPKQWLPTQVLMSSIRRRTTCDVRFGCSWTPELGWRIPQNRRLKRGTAFSSWRWYVQTPPHHRSHEGMGASGRLYLDADVCVFADLVELFDMFDPSKVIQVVTEARGVFGSRHPEPGRRQTSVMLSNPQHPLYPRLLGALMDHMAGRLSYRDLMQATFLPDEAVGSLPPEWNLFGVDEPGKRIVHWSHVASQPWRTLKHPATALWLSELRASMDAGHVTRDDVVAAIGRGGVHPRLLGVLDG